MSEEQLKAFWAAIQADAGLQEKLSAAKDADTVVAIANDAGFVISAEELKRAQAVQAAAQLSEEELEGAAGGTGHTLDCATVSYAFCPKCGIAETESNK
jgi:predicted ribosomally synthesized peptide with nif11-like leader